MRVHQMLEFLTRMCSLVLLLIPVWCFATEVELIENGSFTNGSTSWVSQGSDYWIGTNLSNYRTSPGYAALGVSGSGAPKNNADGALYQTISIPNNTTKLTISFWYYITSEESGSTQYDFLSVTARDATGNTSLADIVTVSNIFVNNTYAKWTYELTENLTVGQMRIRFGASSDATKPTVFRIDDVSVVAEVAAATQTPPVSPTSLSPGVTAQSGIEVTGTPALSWGSVQGATEYMLYLYNFDKKQIVANNIRVQGTSYTPSALTEGDTYLWSVAACNASGCGTYNQYLYFKVKESVAEGVPPKPGISTPGNLSRPGVEVKTTTPTLVLVSDAKQYTFHIRVFDFMKNSYVVQDLQVVSDKTVIEYVTSALTPGHEFKWDAEACNDIGCSGYADPHYFYIKEAVAATNTPPPIPMPTQPGTSAAPGSLEENSERKVTLTWESSPGATYYNAKVQYYDPAQNTYTDETGVNGHIGTSYTTQPLTKSGQYRWFVQGCTDTACSSFSSSLYFRILSAIPTPIITVVDYVEDINKIEIYWDDAVLAGAPYFVQIEKKIQKDLRIVGSWESIQTIFEGKGALANNLKEEIPAPGTRFCYRIKWALQNDPAQYSSYSDESCITISLEHLLPTNIQISSTSGNGISITATLPQSNVVLERSEGGDIFLEHFLFSTAGEIQWTDTNVDDGVWYCYRFKKENNYTEEYCQQYKEFESVVSDYDFDVDIKANNQDNNIKVVQGEKVLVSLSFNSSDAPDGDWWVAATSTGSSLHGLYTFNGGSWLSGEHVYAQGTLSNFSSLTIWNNPLPPGKYKLYFGFDLLKNAVLDIVNGQLAYDVVEVEVKDLKSFDFRMPLPGGHVWRVTTEIGGTACNDPLDEAHTDKNIQETGTYYFIDFSTLNSKSNFTIIDKNVPVLAAADGYIVESGNTAERGNYVVIDHDEDKNKKTGITSWYLHLKDSPTISGWVEQGDPIGVVGKTGTDTEHLHFGFKYYGRSLSTDPVLSNLKMDGRFLQDYKKCDQNLVKLPGYESSNRDIPW